MTTELLTFNRHDKRDLPEHRLADKIATDLHTHLNTTDIQSLILAANAPGASSAVVQAVFLEFAKSVGFKDECEGLFEDYPNSALRPDYYFEPT
jgi:hypothetical protein